MTIPRPRVDYKVVKSELLNTKNQKPYYALELRASSEVGGLVWEARIWDDVVAKLPWEKLPQVGQYWTHVNTRPNVFQGKEQLVVLGYNIIDAAFVTEDEAGCFEDPPAVDVDRVLARMFEWRFWDHDMRSLMRGVVKELQDEGVFEKIRSIPAGAAYHHSVKGGFLLHIDELLCFADRLCGVTHHATGVNDIGKEPNGEVLLCQGVDHYQGVVDYPILRAAIVLHDIGKVYDYNEKTLKYQPNPVSDCLEHTLVGVQMVDRHWPKKTTTPESVERELRLKHAIAAHHGKEMGVVVPKTPEAILLHHLDMISACLDVCRRAYRGATSGVAPEYSKMIGAVPFVPLFPPSALQRIFLPEQERPDFQQTEIGEKFLLGF